MSTAHLCIPVCTFDGTAHNLKKNIQWEVQFLPQNASDWRPLEEGSLAYSAPHDPLAGFKG